MDMEFEVDGFLYDVNEDGKSVTVKEYTNTDVSCSESVTIPSKVTFDGMTYDVTSIGNWAFNIQNERYLATSHKEGYV